TVRPERQGDRVDRVGRRGACPDVGLAAVEPLAGALVLVVAENALLVQLAKLLEGPSLLGLGFRRRRSPRLSELVRVDAELPEPRPHPLDAEAAGRESVGLGARERALLDEAAIRGDERGRGADLEQDRREGVPGAVEDVGSAERGGRDPAADQRAEEPDRDGEPERHRIRAGDDPASCAADEEAAEDDGEDRAHSAANRTRRAAPATPAPSKAATRCAASP